MDYFINRGAELQQGNPFAFAFCSRIRTVLRPYTLLRQRIPGLQEQANIALRHHCKEGNLKWIALMLWAGADPFKAGTESPNEELNGDYEGLSALGFAALYGHYEVFDLKPIRSRPAGPEAVAILPFLTRGKGLDVLKRLLERGLNPNDQSTGVCPAIQSCLEAMSWDLHYNRTPWEREVQKRAMDTAESREKLKAIHLLAKHGAKWIPEDKSDINSARRALLRLKADYTAEFVWIMSKYKASTLQCVQALLSSPTMKSHIAAHRQRISEVTASW
jgi:hypothetical protein